MNKNVKIAKQLVKIAKELITAYGRGRTEEEFKKDAEDIASEIEEDVLDKMGWKRKGSIKFDQGGTLKRNDGTSGYIADVTVEEKDDDAASWDEIANQVSLDFGRYGGHYKCLFDCEKEGHIVIQDSSEGF